jgi:hypothetical protein
MNQESKQEHERLYNELKQRYDNSIKECKKQGIPTISLEMVVGQGLISLKACLDNKQIITVQQLKEIEKYIEFHERSYGI